MPPNVDINPTQASFLHSFLPLIISLLHKFRRALIYIYRLLESQIINWSQELGTKQSSKRDARYMFAYHWDHRILIGYQGLSNLAAQLKRQVLTKHMEVTKRSNLLLEEKKTNPSEQRKMDTRRKNAQQLN